MKLYLWRRTFMSIAIGGMLSVGVVVSHFINAELFKSSQLFYGLGLFLVPWFFSNSSWYSMLPYSRKKLYFLHVLQVIVQTAALFALFVSTECLLSLIGAKNEDTLYVSLSLGFMNTIFLILIPLKPRPSMTGVDREVVLRRLPWVLGVVSVAAILLHGGGVAWILFGCGLAAILCIPAMPLRALTLPQRSFRKLQRFLGASFVAIYLPIISISFALAVWGRANNLTDNAISFLGIIPIPMSEARAVELFASPKMTDSFKMSRAVMKTQGQIPWDLWKRRTEACDSEGCFNLSAIARSQDLTSAQELETLRSLVRVCDPSDQKTFSRCRHERLEDDYLEPRLVRFAASSDVDRWLAGDDEKEQIIAIRSLARSKLVEKQRLRITALTQSKNSIVSGAARNELNYSEAGEKPRDCRYGEQIACHPRTLSELF